jgi:protein subunit release factor B
MKVSIFDEINFDSPYSSPRQSSPAHIATAEEVQSKRFRIPHAKIIANRKQAELKAKKKAEQERTKKVKEAAAKCAQKGFSRNVRPFSMVPFSPIYALALGVDWCNR